MTFWHPAKISAGKSPNTIEQYRHVAKDWIILHIIGVTALTPSDIDKLAATLGTERSALGRDGLSPRSIQMAVMVLKMASKWASHNELMPRDPRAANPRPKAKSEPGTIWNVERARALLGPRGRIATASCGLWRSTEVFAAAN